MRAPTKTATCGKCRQTIGFYPEPDDDEARNWSNDETGSYCPVDGLDHDPQNPRAWLADKETR